MSSTSSVGDLAVKRRHCIPVLYTKGTHYDVGFDVGRTFGALIKSFLQAAHFLNEDYLPLYQTPDGAEAYQATLASVKQSFPQYIRELQGIADGAQVEFHKLFLLHMDEILPRSLIEKNSILAGDQQQQPIGCTTICVNQPENEVIGHSEDALAPTLNHYYIVSAHIIDDTPQGKYQVTEEKFTSLCYAGHLPGYTMGYNHHGMVATINTMSAKHLRAGKTPRHFIARALLAAENFAQAQVIMRDHGVGAGDGCSFNLTFLRQEGDRLFHNAEMGPTESAHSDESQLNVLTASPGEHIFHANRYLRLAVPEVGGMIVDSSVDRQETFNAAGAPRSRSDVLRLLGDTSHGRHQLFRDNGRPEEVKTIAVGLFDCQKRTWELFADNPRSHAPLVTLPLLLKE